MPVSKSRFKRKAEKRLEWVKFEVEFAEGEFVMPDQKNLPIRVARHLTGSGDIDALISWLKDSKVDEDVLEFIDDMDQVEMMTFMDAWSNDSTISLGKSEG